MVSEMLEQHLTLGKVFIGLVASAAIAISSGGFWVGSLDSQIDQNSADIVQLKLTSDYVIRMDERQMAITNQLDRIEEALAELE